MTYSYSLEELQKLLGVKLPLSAQILSPGEDAEESSPSGQVKLEQWIEAVHRFDENTLSQGFFEEWARQGLLKFILNFAVPFIYQVGKGWETGELTVSQEHFASERLEHFLSGMWRRMNERKEGPAVLLTTLPGDPHRLGIQMCSVVTSLTEAKLVYLGPNTPCDDIVSAVEQSEASILCFSISPTMSPAKVENYLVEIRASLGKGVDMVIGGNGAPEGIPGIKRFDGFGEYFDWLTARRKT